MRSIVIVAVVLAALWALQRVMARRTLPCVPEEKPAAADPAMPDDVLVDRLAALADAATPKEALTDDDVLAAVPTGRAAVVAVSALRLALQRRRPGRFTEVGNNLRAEGNWAPWLLPDADVTSSYVTDERTHWCGYSACRFALHRTRREIDRWVARPPSFWVVMFLNTFAAVEPDADVRRALLAEAAARPTFRLQLFA